MSDFELEAWEVPPGSRPDKRISLEFRAQLMWNGVEEETHIALVNLTEVVAFALFRRESEPNVSYGIDAPRPVLFFC